MGCSGIFPCQNIKLMNINLTYTGPGGVATSSCSNVLGQTFGTQNPSGCLSNFTPPHFLHS
ncbi:galacturonan 1,4-alpha-galacturonidase [Sarracenia purpurea var. burkii]